MNKIININDLSEEQANRVFEFIQSLRDQFQNKQAVKKEKRADGKSILRIIKKLHQIDKDFKFDREEIYNERLRVHR